MLLEALLTLSLLPAILAQSQQQPVVSLIMVETYYVASIITGDATATTYSLRCPASLTSECEDISTGYSFTGVSGASTLGATFGLTANGTYTGVEVDCTTTQGTAGTCTGIFTDGTNTSSTVGPMSGEDFASISPITVTGGFENVATAISSEGSGPTAGPNVYGAAVVGIAGMLVAGF
ncbi:hypothetical protein BU26DRAFT_511180 [Trematosphaeria pertusa]|uniref:GPI anchored protein n=1 Tax=Trematosphaeria pertusa TaxID=390896 RepID=A0A6A6HV61_9PLEO|nr:uncharacterized protein BU26DRAFT_511180 [Trematosphaeria pertusa]KAF2241769.1 hypothetical protein BU26DRAFT_511180 [Trematosphaeria pertusa]